MSFSPKNVLWIPKSLQWSPKEELLVQCVCLRTFSLLASNSFSFWPRKTASMEVKQTRHWRHIEVKWRNVSRSIASDSLWPHGLGLTRLPGPLCAPCFCERSRSHSTVRALFLQFQNPKNTLEKTILFLVNWVPKLPWQETPIWADVKLFVALFVLLGGTIHSLSWKFHCVVYGALS